MNSNGMNGKNENDYMRRSRHTAWVWKAQSGARHSSGGEAKPVGMSQWTLLGSWE